MVKVKSYSDKVQCLVADFLNELVFTREDEIDLRRNTIKSWKKCIDDNPTDKLLQEINNIINTLNIENEDWIKQIKAIANKYGVLDDPFTGAFCSRKDWGKSYDNYYSQAFEEKWGYPPEWDD